MMSEIDSNCRASAVLPQINVNVTYGGPQFGRVVTANEAVTRGDLLASIPLDLAWNTATSGGNGTMQVCYRAWSSQLRCNQCQNMGAACCCCCWPLPSQLWKDHNQYHSV
jgi:hypothetical protein